MVAGWWKPHMCHINKLELQAIKKTLYALETQIMGKSILVCCDNVTAIAYSEQDGWAEPTPELSDA
jgi:hypothetical protein